MRVAPIATVLLLAGSLMAGDEPGEFSIRPCLPLDQAVIETLRRQVATDPAITAVADQVRAEAKVLVAQKPTPLAKIHYEGLVNTDPRRIADVEALRSMDAVATLLHAWQAGADASIQAALHAHLRAWATTYRPNGNDVNENKLVPLLVAFAAVGADLPATDRALVAAWIEDLGTRHAAEVTASTHLTNRYTKHVRLAVFCGRALGRDDWVDLGRVGIQRFVGESLRADGTSLDLERRDSLTYHCSALVPALELALLMGAKGRDLYTWEAATGASLKRSVDYVVPYATGEKTRAEWVNTTVDLDRRRAAAGIEKYRAGRLFDPKDACSVLGAASSFDPGLLPVLAKADGDAIAQPVVSWPQVVRSAITTTAEASPR